MIEEITATLGISKAAASAGGVGAALAAARSKEASKIQRGILFMLGFSAAVYMPKIVVVWFKLPDDPSFHAGVAFVIGYFGPSIMDAVGEAVGSVRNIDWKTVLTGWVSRR